MAYLIQLVLAVCSVLFVSSYTLQATTNQERPLIYVDAKSKVNNASCWNGELQYPCNSLELALQGVHNLSSIHPWIFLLPGEYVLKSSKHSIFAGPISQDFGLIANGSGDANTKPEASIVCDFNVGFCFRNVQGITIRNVLLDGCSMVVPSTSRNRIRQTFWDFRVGLYLVNCSEITLEHVWVINTKGIGTYLYSSYGNNRIDSCRFSNNSAMYDLDHPAGGGLYIEYSSCIPVDDNTCTSLAQDQYKPSNMLINNTVFDRNSAKVAPQVSNNDYWLLPSGLNHSSIGRGGGLSIIFEGYSSNISVHINNLQFNDNSALWGGGLFVEFHDNSNYNEFELENVTFSNNSVEKESTGGGGARLGFIFYEPSRAHNNTILFDHCHFINNSARFGGGVSFYTAREPNVLEPSNKLEFSFCDWKENSAWLGAAIDMTAWQADSMGISVLVDFHHIYVFNNTILQTNWTLRGLGALYTDSVPIRFKGLSSFELNYGTALAATGASIAFSFGSITSFQTNTGRNGGAIQLIENSFMILDGADVLGFFSNTAEQKGGAIFVETGSKHDLITSPNCFIRYKNVTVHPDDWSCKIVFSENVANGKDNSIYITTTKSCEWPGNVEGSTVLCWRHWSYIDSNGLIDNCTRQIQTDPKQFQASSNSSIDTVQIYPGQQKKLSVDYTMTDDFGNDATERVVLTANIKEYWNTSAPASNRTNDISVTATIPEYLTHNILTMYGKTNNTYTVELFTIDPRVVYTMVEVELLPCPFGFVNATDNSKQDETFKCVCSNEETFNRIVQCSTDTLTSSLNLLGQWAGVNNDTGHRVAGYCPYTKNLRHSELTLPQKNPGNNFCNKINREGVLCGKCQNDTGPAINSETYKCVDCSAGIEYYSWILYLCSEILPLTIFFLILIVLNISLTSGTANAFVFYSQVISTTFGLYYGSGEPLYHTLRDVYRSVYGIWNLDIFSTLPFLQYCLSPKLTTLHIISLEYVIAFYPLFLIIVLYSMIAMYNSGVRPVRILCKPIHHCSIRLRNVWNPKNSMIDAIAAFILLSYSRIILTSTKLLRYSQLYRADGSVQNTVAYYDGTVTAFESGHLPFAIIASVILIIFVPIPLVLLLYPLRSVRRVANHTLAKCCLLGGRFEQFLNAFYGSFKDGAEKGTRDYRFFAGLYLIYRVVFALIRFAGEWGEIYLLQNVFCLLAFLMFAILKPYRKDVHNTLDACMFALLLLISLLNQYNFNLIYLDNDSDNASGLVFTVEYLMIWIPFIVVVCLLLRWVWKSCKPQLAKRVSRRTTQLEATLSHAEIQPTASSVIDDNSIMKLVDERPQMYNYGTIPVSPVNSSDTDRSSRVA